ncbi:DUF1566 domain-containing protein [Wenzhouxiangella sp. AB-CW3]|uniref:Lcl C-terminal domain-containing protein n=1 Tax=Wenzhouxiangella sp. AB-CW3 TaxID=2771012 RepID=UPI00168B3F5A|nr:DUF1566 domain-containing protein [Wenzhouxiangella sp. AB-CW3]QOC22506.1 DUF1566 domain-containing protein [Wenzhouxiangella sp. AB-CW3]
MPARLTIPTALAVTLIIAACGGADDAPPVSDSWSRIGPDGETLADNDPDHHCIFDERTGLMWEVKREDAGLHQPGQQYSWYFADEQINMGEPGARDDGDCVNSRCDTEGFASAVNEAGLCGFHDWRVPTRNEMMTLGDRRLMDETGLIVDPAWLPHVKAGEYWASETFRLYPQSAWAVDMRHGLDRADHKKEVKAVRLVRQHRTPAQEIDG